MRKTILLLIAFVAALSGSKAAESTDTVKIAYDGNVATVTIPASLSGSVKNMNGTSSYVDLTQSSTETEIVYSLSGATTDGGFTLTGTYKTTVCLNGVTITSTQGTALNIQNGKRIKIKMVEGTENTLTDSSKGTQKGCLVVKGHTEFRGKGTLNVFGNTAHAIKSGEYISIKNCTINVKAAEKDGFSCNEYFCMESGNIHISGVEDDGIQVEVDSDIQTTGTTDEHEDENSGNFYAEAPADTAEDAIVGTITISDDNDGKAIKVDGKVVLGKHFTYHFDTSDIKEGTPDHIATAATAQAGTTSIYHLDGRQVSSSSHPRKGIVITRSGNQTKKIMTF